MQDGTPPPAFSACESRGAFQPAALAVRAPLDVHPARAEVATQRQPAGGASQPAEAQKGWHAKHGWVFSLDQWNPEDPDDVDPTAVPLPPEEPGEMSSEDSVNVTPPWEIGPDCGNASVTGDDSSWSNSEYTDDGSETAGVSRTGAGRTGRGRAGRGEAG